MDSAGGTTDLATIGTRASSVGVATLFRATSNRAPRCRREQRQLRRFG